MCSEKRVMLQLCRLCQHNIGTNMISEDSNLAIIIKRVTKVEVNDVLKKHMPNSICITCNSILINTYKFIETTQQVDKALRSAIEEKLQTLGKNSADECQQSEPFTCCICNKQFEKEVSYNIHRKSHIEIYCNCCRCIFKDPLEKNKHICVNSGKAPSTSLEINNSCGIASDETFNEKPHQNFTCQIKDCTKVFSSQSAHNNHKLYHDAKRPFLCVTCGKRFHTRNSLNCHENIHREQKLYKCLECNLAFSAKSNLQAHLKKYHEGVRFYCSQCPKQFLGKDSLHRHEKIHIGIKEFRCQECTSAFYTSKELVKHQRYHQINFKEMSEENECERMDSETQKSEKMFTLKKWNAVAMWSWDVECDTCAICRVQVMDACLRCQAESKKDSYGKQDCVVVWGECNHSFHYCCMSLWVKQNNRCPLCQQEWSIQRMGK